MLYLSEVEKTKMLDAENESKLAYLAAAGDQEAREKLVLANLRFVLSVAKMYASKPEDFLDLVAAGNEGLIEASGKFDPTRGFKFISFAVWYIRKEMIKYLSENSRTIKVPTNQVQVLKALFDASGQLSALEGREVSDEEALEFLKEKNPKFSSTDYKILNSASVADRRPASLDQELTNDRDSGTLLDVLEADGDKADEFVMKSNDKLTARVLMNCLTGVERGIVIRYFGLDDESGLGDSVQSIASDIGYNVESVRVKLKKALKKMKERSIKLKMEKSDIF